MAAAALLSCERAAGSPPEDQECALARSLSHPCIAHVAAQETDNVLTHVQAPDAAQELTPAQQAAIKSIFSPPSAGKEDASGAITYPAHAPDPAEHLTPAQREQLRRIFADSPLASPPSSGDTNSSSPAAGVPSGSAAAAAASSMTGGPCSLDGMNIPRQCCSAAAFQDAPEVPAMLMRIWQAVAALSTANSPTMNHHLNIRDK